MSRPVAGRKEKSEVEPADGPRQRKPRADGLPGGDKNPAEVVEHRVKIAIAALIDGHDLQTIRAAIVADAKAKGQREPSRSTCVHYVTRARDRLAVRRAADPNATKDAVYERVWRNARIAYADRKNDPASWRHFERMLFEMEGLQAAQKVEVSGEVTHLHVNIDYTLYTEDELAQLEALMARQEAKVEAGASPAISVAGLLSDGR